MNQLQFTFPWLGKWDAFTMNAVWTDEYGYTHSKRYTQNDIPSDQLGALAGVITAIAGLGEPWQATQVWARLVGIQVGEETALDENDQLVDLPVVRDAIELTVEARHTETGGRRVFTMRDYPESFLIEDENAVEFFKYFTK